MSCGKDGKPDSNGIQRWTPRGRFKEIADSMKGEREYGAMGIGVKDEDESISDKSHDSTEGEGGSHSPEGKGAGDTNPSTESRFTFTEGNDRVPSPFDFTDETDDSNESRFTFCEYE
jgi:hypothetical protein